MRSLGQEPHDDSLAVLLLPGRLEGFALERHARDLLSIPRVIALECPRVRLPGFVRHAASLRQGRRLRFPGRLRLLVLYHPAQYPLARALCANHEGLELWYVRSGHDLTQATGQAQARELATFDELARERARQVIGVGGEEVDDADLRARLREAGVITHRPFTPDAWGWRR
jgi:hypothetical protein